jgi:hypothetical protein
MYQQLLEPALKEFSWLRSILAGFHEVEGKYEDAEPQLHDLN